VIGLYGNSKQEAMHPFYGVDSDKQQLIGTSHYKMRFVPDGLPPVNAFWSLTIYECRRVYSQRFQSIVT